MNKKKTETEEPRFEDALQRLEAIVEEMESGRLSLDDLLIRFEEGRELAKFCGGKLESVEQKIHELVEKDNQLTEVERKENPEQTT